jgi:hypothetical protein
MELSSAAVSMEMDIATYPPSESWEKRAYELYVTVELTNMGQRMLEQASEPLNLDKDGNIIGLRANGSVAIWGLRYNERLRMIEKMKRLSKDKDCRGIRDLWLTKYQDESLALYKELLDDIIKVYNSIKSHEEAYERISHYISSTNKTKSAIFSREGIDYLSIKETPDLNKTIETMAQFIQKIRDNMYGPYRANDAYFVPALRQRPPPMKPEEFKEV